MEDGVLGEGWYGLDEKRADHKPLKHLIEGEARAEMHRRGNLWIGPEALAWLLAGKVRFEEEEGDEQRKTPKKYHPCKLGALLAGDAVDPAWRTADVLRLARQVQEGSEPDAWGVLADALEDAGCASAAVLGHCRWTGKHLKDCWVAGLILGCGPPGRH
jgi:hypothetical protein